MVTYKIINKSKSESVVLIHGLFANSGYWLPYLTYLKAYRLIVLDIDFASIVNVETYVESITNIIVSETKSKLNIVISHSLGSLLAALLPTELYDLSVEICPVHSSNRINHNAFLDDMKSRLKLIESETIISNLINADVAINKYSGIAQSQHSKRVRYFPNRDMYFMYDKSKSDYILFDGDHFNIENAFANISFER